MSASGWKIIRLGNVVSINEKSISSNYPHKTIEYIDTASVTNNRFEPLQVLNIDEAPSRAKRIVQDGDTIISTVRPIQRHFGFIRKANENTIASTGFTVLTPKRIHPEYLYYHLSQEQITLYLNGIAETTTTTFPAFRPDTLAELEISIPESFETQTRIAAILSSLDDKIELNRQTNATLEVIAQAIFKEWFVEFRFPGSIALTTGGAPGEMQESELGMIPKGWRVGSIGDILKLSNESITPGTAPNVKFFHFSIPSFDNGRIPVIEQATLILSHKFKVRNNSILVSKLNPRIPRIWAVGEVDEEKSICSTEFQVLLPIKNFFYSFALNLFSQSSIIEAMKSRASGTSGSHQRIRPQDILDIKTIIPENEIIIQFEKVVGIYSHYITTNLTESVTLSQIRDSLLPKLMSGEIEV